MRETAITFMIIILDLLIVILFGGVSVTDERKGIINEHMSCIEFIELVKGEENGKR